MKRSAKVRALASALVLVTMAGAAVLVRAVDRARPDARLQEILYVPSPKLLKRLSLGYDGLLADIYWTRVVQYFGGVHRRGGGSYQLLWPLLNITTQLDPHLVPAYEFGGTFLCAKPPNGAGLPEKAIELIQHGIKNNPRDWHLYYDLAFIYYDQKDYRNSAEAFLHGSELPGAHPFLKIMAAQMAEHGGDLNTARMMWSATYETTHDEMIRANAAAHLRAIQAEADVNTLEDLARQYRNRTGHFPESFSQMASVGLRGIPLDPVGHPYRLELDGKVVVSDPADLPFLDKGLPAGYVPGPLPRLTPAR
jgi:tetratricopeptide (TPR) repeat protein